ncbi:MAG TPA: TetR/AcrR family transcriptional regulator [Oleiagrimonas sp.]|nr:TetR/AcrR family transcriptional regulator [Oleiagrimonas sp.]
MNTRDRILEAAEQVIRSHGFARATTKEIARAADCSEGSLYNHFKGKEDLFLCILRERLPTFIRQLIEFPGRAGSGTVQGNLREMAQTALAFYRQSIPLGASIVSEPALLDRQREVLREKNIGPHKANELFAAYLRAEQQSGRLDADADTESVAAAILGACFQRAYMAEILGREPSDTAPDAFIDKVLEAVLAGWLPTRDS